MHQILVLVVALVAVVLCEQSARGAIGVSRAAGVATVAHARLCVLGSSWCGSCLGRIGTVGAAWRIGVDRRVLSLGSSVGWLELGGRLGIVGEVVGAR